MWVPTVRVPTVRVPPRAGPMELSTSPPLAQVPGHTDPADQLLKSRSWAGVLAPSYNISSQAAEAGDLP